MLATRSLSALGVIIPWRSFDLVAVHYDSRRMHPQLLRNLRHELRTPINHILGYAELLLEDARDLQRPDLVADLEGIHAAGKQLLKPIADHLNAAQLELT